MDAQVQGYFDDLESKDKRIQYEAHHNLLTITKKEVKWAYEVWDQLIQELTDHDHPIRSHAAQFLVKYIPLLTQLLSTLGRIRITKRTSYGSFFFF